MMPKRKVASARVTSAFQLAPCFCQGRAPTPQWLTWALGMKPRNGRLLPLWWPEGPGMRHQQRWQHQSRSHSAHQDHKLRPKRREGRARSREPALAAGCQGTTTGKHKRESPSATGAQLPKHGAEKFPLPLRREEEAATSPSTQASRLQCWEQRWHPCTTTLELGREEHPLAPRQRDVQPNRRLTPKPRTQFIPVTHPLPADPRPISQLVLQGPEQPPAPLQ